MTPAEALVDIRGYARSGRVEFTHHAPVRARQRSVRIDEVDALAYPWASRLEKALDRLRAFGETRIPRGPVPLRLARAR